MTMAVEREQRWEHNLKVLPFVLLALATVISVATISEMGPRTLGMRVTFGVLVAATAVWIWRWMYVYGRPHPVGYVGRTLLAAALTVVHPLFCIFAWVGFLDAFESFRGRWRWVAMAVTSLIMATGQTGGPPPYDSPWQSAALPLLFVVNFGLASLMARYSMHLDAVSQERADTIVRLEHALTENARLHEKLLAQSRQTGVRDERERLAREIHDTIAQSLAGVVAQLQAAEGSADAGDAGDVRRRVARATEMARTALVEARRSVQDLSPTELTDAGLLDALSRLIESWNDDHDVEASFVVVGEATALHSEVEATLLRIAQEALANVAKHAEASRVGVTLTFDESEVILDVRDDGCGFDPTGPRRDSAFGLGVMRTRAQRLAGTFTLESAPGAGTALSARIPALPRGAA
ncbi:sensor histidine kinase [Nocardioides albus]|uniref:Oxygen sensor histidine kinase NreB n=1 Tax=Nocardioides albus TaxID=1841 RepID=A0A7W5A6V2_9ACTN|nr:sensor histidine kinase [Nocardioides albus]MBB3090299.1 signal transduction histidine kinase [Nocardioides albus]GGU29137.1 histidine kinase [Nocardioides albus]